MTGQGMFSIRVVRSLEEFETLSVRWNALLKETSSDHIFLTWEWLYTWSKHYLGADQRRIILVFEGEDQLVGIAPLYIRRAKTYGGFTLREMKFLGTEEVCSSYLDFIVSEKNKKAVLRQIFRYLHEDARGEWDILTLSEIPAESSSIDIWHGFIQEAGKVMEVVGTTSCPVIDLTGGFEHFRNEIGRNQRYNLQRKRKRLEEGGHVEYYRASTPREVEKEMDTFIHLHQVRWEQDWAGGAFQRRRFLMFHQEISRVFSQKGWIHLDFLLLNGEKVAGIYGFIYDGRYSYYLPGRNPVTLPQASPGVLLLFHCIEEAIREGCLEFDLLRGLVAYKMAWANRLRRSLTLRHYNKHVRAAAFKLLESGKEIVKVLVR